VSPARGSDERITLDFRFARQGERFQSREADSLGLSVSLANVASVDMDLRVMDLPMKGAARPSLHVHGRALTTEQVFVASAGGPGAPELPLESPLLAVDAGIGLVVPLAIVDGASGVNATIRYEGGVVLAADTGENFMQRSTVALGFERAGGVLDGSLIEASFGHNDLFGPTWSAGRWGARMLMFMALGRVGAPALTGAETPAAMAGPAGRVRGAPLRAFVELALDTDGRPGADALAARVGMALEIGSVLGSVFER
jgi:hypothetical protein